MTNSARFPVAAHLALLFLVALVWPALAWAGEPDTGYSLSIDRLRGAPLVAVHGPGPLLLLEDAQAGLTAIDAQSGRVRWFVQSAGLLDQPPQLAGQILSLCSQDWLLLVDARDGKRLAQRILPAIPSHVPVLIDPILFVPLVAHGRLLAIDVDTNREIWHIDLPGGVAQSLLAFGRGGAAVLVVACGDGSLRALPGGRGVPGGELWVNHTGPLAGPPARSGENIVSVGRLGWLVRSQRASSGKLDWSATLPAEPLGAGLVVGSSVVVPTTGGLLALSAATGKVLWRSPPGEHALGVLGDALLLRGADGEVLLRAGDDGRLLRDDLPPSTEAHAGVLLELGADGVRHLLP